MRGRFDGHANCFIESGFGKGILIDFNYDTEPLPGKFPLPGIGPFSLLEETEMNHYGKIMFRWMYWNFLLKTGYCFIYVFHYFVIKILVIALLYCSLFHICYETLYVLL
jgi:hypothetical protein